MGWAVIVLENILEVGMTIASTLRRARENSGMTLRTAASISGVGAGNLSAIERGLRDPTTATASKIAEAIGIRFVPIPANGRSSAADAVEEILLAEAAADAPWAYRAFLQLANDLAAVSAVDRLLLSAEEPRRTHTRWDDAVAGLAEWRLRQLKAPVPEWILSRPGRADDPWEPQRTSFPLDLRTSADDVPEPLRRRGVMMGSDELTSA